MTDLTLAQALIKIEQLQDRIDELERAFGMTGIVPYRLFKEFKRGPMCEILFRIILAREFVSRDAAFIAMYGNRPECEQPELKILDVYLAHIRKGIRPHGIVIETIYGKGWHMPTESKRIALDLIAQRQSIKAA